MITFQAVDEVGERDKLCEDFKRKVLQNEVTIRYLQIAHMFMLYFRLFTRYRVIDQNYCRCVSNSLVLNFVFITVTVVDVNQENF